MPKCVVGLIVFVLGLSVSSEIKGKKLEEEYGDTNKLQYWKKARDKTERGVMSCWEEWVVCVI